MRMKRTISVFLLLALLLTLFGCAGETARDETTVQPPAEETMKEATEEATTPVYEGELPDDLFGVFDEESYTNGCFGVKYLRDGSWKFFTTQELASVNGGAFGETEAETLKRVGCVYDMYARCGQDTLGFTLAIPAVQFGKAMTEEEYAQAVKEASARDYAGTDYDVVSDELGTAQFGGAEHACFDLTVAANGMIFYTKQIFIQQGDFTGVICVSSQGEDGRASLLSHFSGT